MRLPTALRTPAAVVAGTRAVLERDFIVLTSLSRFIALRTMTIVLTAFIIGTVLVEVSGQQPSEMGQGVLLAIAFAAPALVALLGPSLAAPAISSERSIGTLDLVLAAPVTPASFVLAKFLSRLLTVLVLVLATMPVASLSLVYGGVTLELFGEVYLLTLAFAGYAVATGILTSAFSRRVAAAVLRAYSLAVVVPVLWVFLSGFVTQLAPNWGWWPRFVPFETLFAPSPIGAWSQVIEQAGGTGGPTGGVVGKASLILLAASAGSLALASWRLAREAGFRTARGKARRARRLRMPFGRPALARAVRGTLVLRPTRSTLTAGVLVLIGWGCSVWLAVTEGGNDADFGHVGILVGLTGLLVLRALAASASQIAEQRQQGSLALLLTTPVTAREVVQDGFAAAYVSVLPLLVLGVGHAVVAVVAGPLVHEAALAWLAATAVYIGLAAAIGLRVSVSASTAGRAVLRAFAIFLGGSVLVGLVGWLIAVAARNPGEEILFWFGLAPPVTLVGAPIGTLGVLTHLGGDDAVGLAAMGLWLVLHAAAIPPLLASAAKALRPER